MQSYIMLDENSVIAALCVHFDALGYRVEQRLVTTQRGVDLIVANDETGERLFIEAKGGTSSRLGSNRFGKPYNQSQVFDLVSKGLFATLKTYAQLTEPGDYACLAVPRTAWFMRYLEAVRPVLTKLGLKVFIVDNNGAVTAF